MESGERCAGQRFLFVHHSTLYSKRYGKRSKMYAFARDSTPKVGIYRYKKKTEKKAKILSRMRKVSASKT